MRINGVTDETELLLPLGKNKKQTSKNYLKTCD